MSSGSSTMDHALALAGRQVGVSACRGGTVGSVHGDGTACTGASIFRVSGLIKAAFIDHPFPIPVVLRLLQTLY